MMNTNKAIGTRNNSILTLYIKKINSLTHISFIIYKYMEYIEDTK